MIADHKYLYRLLVDFLVENDFDKAEKLFQRFTVRLEKHFKMEDELIFPLFNEHLGLENNNSLAEVMNRDHQNIYKLLKLTKKYLSLKDRRKIDAIGPHFKKVLSKHHKRENLTHYPIFNNFISVPDEKFEKAFARIYNTEIKNKNKGEMV